jgi:iron complex transport system substrate-binding protein
MNSIRRFFLAALATFAAAACGAAVHVDDAGRSVDFARPPQRVVTLAPNLTEFVYAVGAGATLVGTMDTSNYPEAATRVPRIGDYQRLDVERILSLKPELVLVWYHGNQGRELAQLEAAGIRLFYLEPRSVDDVARDLVRIGALLGHAAEGEARAAALNRDFAALRARYAHAPPVSVFFQVWAQPLMTLNGQHLTSDLLALCGGVNVFGALSALAPQISMESVVAADPEAIFGTRRVDDAQPRWRREPQRDGFRMWQRFGELTAVRRSWFFTVPGDLVTRQGPRAIEGARAVCGALDQVRAERRVPAGR